MSEQPAPVALWLDQTHPPRPRPELAGQVTADVAVVGAGFTGLWTAYHLARARPGLRVVVLERESVGFGAAGRNGGWVGAGIAGSAAVYARRSGWPATREAARLTERAVDEIGEVSRSEGIDCAYRKGGTLTVARTRPQWRRVQDDHAHAVRTGLLQPGARLLSSEEVREVVSTADPVGGAFTPHCARVQPARLALGLAAACERRGVVILEHSDVLEVAEGKAVTAHGEVRADSVLLATEAWTGQLPGHRGRYLPLTSMMLATAPLPAEVWRQLGWPQGLTVRDRRHLFFYAQRTDDDRIALGGRGAPYSLRHPLDEVDERSARHAAVWTRLEHTLHEYFPATAGAPITHRWGGTLAVPRDWSMAVRYDPGTRRGFAGGYAGHGVVAAYLAGRALADLVLGTPSAYTQAPWVGHRSRRWEPEPLRYLAANAIVRLLDSADRHEDSTGRTSRRVAVVRPFLPPG